MPWLPLTAAIFALLWGSLWGSFLNVVVYRVPAGLSVVRPRSRCGSCGTPIAAWHNIPVVSWLWLRGRCASCKAAISPRYPVVEATVAVLSLALAMPWLPLLLDPAALLDPAGLPWRPALALAGEQAVVFTWLAIALIDADTFLIPDVLSLPLPLVAIALAAVTGDLRGVDLRMAVLGAVVAGLGLWLLMWLYARMTGREGLGLGDVKLLASIGALLGLAAVPVVLLAAALQGLAFALLYALLSRGKATEERGLTSLRQLAIPFGPFLVLGAVEWLLLHRLGAGLMAAQGLWLPS